MQVEGAAAFVSVAAAAARSVCADAMRSAEWAQGSKHGMRWCILGRMIGRSTLAIALFGLAVTTNACAPAMRIGPGPGRSELATLRRGATLGDVAEQFHLGYVELVAANPDVDPWLPGKGTRVVLPLVHLPPSAEHEGIVINLADMRLYYFAAGKLVRSYAIGIGRDGLSTPLGKTTVARKEANPSWRPTARMRKEDPELPEVVPPGPDNPMGKRALYLGWRPYAIHGTNKPPGVGRRVSSGCIRMYEADIEDLYARVAVGTKVTVVDQPVKLAWLDGELYMEAHPTQRQSSALQDGKPLSAKAAPLTSSIRAEVRAAAAKDASRVDWKAVEAAVRERRGYPVRVTRPGA
jgi:L,D-transpeptidase ErfK/SrfK